MTRDRGQRQNGAEQYGATQPAVPSAQRKLWCNPISYR